MTDHKKAHDQAPPALAIWRCKRLPREPGWQTGC